MSLAENLDLALVGFKDLIDLGERKSVDQPSSLSRPELVKELRKMGVGVLPQPSSPNGTLEQLSSLVSCVSTLSKEIVMSREDRASTMLALKLEIQELRREVVELRQQKSSIPTVGSFGAPAPASFSFRIEKDWSADHLFYAKALKQSKVDISQVCQVDLQGKPGHCVVTVKSSAEREKILDAGIRISGKQVLCEISGVDLTHLHVFGCPVGLQNSKLCAALGQFGRIVGSPQQKKVFFEGLEICTGTRVLSLVLRSPVPSTVTVGQLKLRVWHRGQQQTCWRCNNSGHEAKACPNRGAHAQSTASRPPQTQHRNTTGTSTNLPASVQPLIRVR